ncbi:unnamed protein product [Rhodiola kirilowii]
MADTSITRSATLNSDPAPTKKKRRNNARKPLAQKNAESNVPPSPAKAIDSIPAKEVIPEVQPSPKVAKQTKASKKSKQTESSSIEKDLLEMQEKLEQLRLEKEKTELLLKEKYEILKTKEKELEARGKKQDKLEVELKKQQKLKELKPTSNFPMADQSKNQDAKKKKGGSETESPSVSTLKDHSQALGRGARQRFPSCKYPSSEYKL